jgi:hypothetical protein
VNRAFNATMDCGRKLLLGAEDLRDLGEFATNYQRWLNQLERAHREGDRKAVKQRTGGILSSFGAKVCVTIRAIKLQPGQIPPTFAQIKERAANLDPFQPINETVTTWLEPKAAGGYRQLVSFRWKRRALQIMCADILSVAYPAAPFDYSARGKGGVGAATAFLHKLIIEGDCQYVVTVDIRDCFGSAIKKKVGELLPLPKKVVNNVLLVQDDVTVVVKPDKGKWTGCLLPNQLEGEAVLKTLKSLYAASPVGLLAIGRHRITHIKDGYDFVSYNTKLKRKWKVALDQATEWYLHVRPTLRAYEKFEHKAAKKFHEAGGGLAGWKQVFLYMKRWMPSFPMWKPNYLSKLYLWCTLQAGSWHKAAKANSVQSIAQKAVS